MTLRRLFTPILFAPILAAFLTLATLAPARAQAQTTPADSIRQMLERRDQQIKGILAGGAGDSFSPEQRQRLKDLINGVIDFRTMGREALGPFWGDLTPDERARFVDVFQTIVREQSLSDLEVYNSEVTYGAISVEGDSAYVETQTTYKGTRTPVEYDLHRTGSTWVADDIVVNDVSTAAGYARSFQTVMRKRGFDALMQSLERKREQVLSRSSASDEG